MKKTKFLIISILPLFLLSCIMSPDQMLESFNDNLYEDIGGGMYQHGEVIINPELIPRDIYPVIPGGTLRLEISAAYYDYSWSLEDQTSKQKWDIPGFYIVYVGRPNIELIGGHKYTLTLNLKNRNGVKYMDTATLSCVNNS